MLGKRRPRRVAKVRTSFAAFGGHLRLASTRRGSAMPNADYVREFEQFLEEVIHREINYISWVSLTYGRLKREIAAMGSIFPDSTMLTDFACEECGKPLVHHLKCGGEGYDFFGCSGCLEGCMTLYDNRDGRPVRKA
jgi:ssDNA-binding Zn-finger/Zn-ribbon topoisomerase 1